MFSSGPQIELVLWRYKISNVQFKSTRAIHCLQHFFCSRFSRLAVWCEASRGGFDRSQELLFDCLVHNTIDFWFYFSG